MKKETPYEARVMASAAGEEPAWVVFGPGLLNIGGCISHLGDWPRDQRVPLTQAAAMALAGILNDVHFRAVLEAQRSIRESLGIGDLNWAMKVRP